MQQPENNPPDNIRQLERTAKADAAARNRMRHQHQQAIAEAKRLQAEAQFHVAEAIGCFSRFVDAIRRVRAGSGF